MPEVMQKPHASNGARLVSRTGEELPLRGITLTGRAMGGIARKPLNQHFTNAYPHPLELIYVSRCRQTARSPGTDPRREPDHPGPHRAPGRGARAVRIRAPRGPHGCTDRAGARRISSRSASVTFPHRLM